MQDDDPATVIAVGVLAASLADVVHEAMGHGLGCIAVGGQIALLTSIWFRCHDATALTDASGPIGSLVAGLAAFAVLAWTKPDRVLRLFLVMLGAISLLWFAGQLIFHALHNRDDWFFVARQMGWPTAWRPISVALGAGCYYATMRLSAAALPATQPPWRRAIRLAYGASVASAVIAGLLWRPEPIRSGVEAFQTLGVLPVGLLFLRTGRVAPTDAVPIRRSWRWIIAGGVVYAVFAAVQGRGVGPLAATGLPG